MLYTIALAALVYAILVYWESLPGFPNAGGRIVSNAGLELEYTSICSRNTSLTLWSCNGIATEVVIATG